MKNFVGPADLKKNWRRNWLYSLYEFSNIQYQRRVWIEAAYKGVIGSYIECMCGYFDDLVLEEGYQARIKEGLLSDAEADVLCRFHELAEEYEPGQKSTEAILSDPDWLRITIEAAKSWHMLKSIVCDQQDIQVMSDLESRFGEIPILPYPADRMGTS